jgi:AhpD family alkylhydroperoxidase
VNHIDIGTTQPTSYTATLELHQASPGAATAAGVSPKLVELVLKNRSSQINGCAYCLRMHVADAVKIGESTDRLAVLAACWCSRSSWRCARSGCRSWPSGRRWPAPIPAVAQQSNPARHRRPRSSLP